MKFLDKFKKKNATPNQEDSSAIEETVASEVSELSETPAEDESQKAKKKPRKPLSKRAKIILICVAVVIVGLLIWGGTYVYHILNPENAFETLQNKPDPTPTVAPDDTQEEDEGPSDYELLMQNADTSIMQNIVNVALIGVDYATERETWNGKKAFHADVIMILAINFDEKTVDMISIPRDTYAKIPGVDGIYKINASIDCGGGWPTEGGFNKVCEAAEWMLGGIPVDYYYAVSMNAVKELVDTIGGVDFDLQMDFKLAGREYTAGYQHMDGQAVLDFLRVRKNHGNSSLTGGKGDLNRVNRQKEMLVAIFNKLKSSNMLVKIPDILEAFDGQLYTNTTFQQTAALALFAYDSLDSENIAMHSMDGTMGYHIFNWNFCLTNQKKRVEIIKEVYGIDVKQYSDYTSKAAWQRWYNMLSTKYLPTAERVLKQADSILAADKLLATPSPSPSPSPSPTATDTPTPEPTTSNAPSTEPQPTSSDDSDPSTEPETQQLKGASLSGEQQLSKVLTGGIAATTGRKYGETEDQLYAAAKQAYEKLKKESKGSSTSKETLDEVYKTTVALAKALGIQVSTDQMNGSDWHYEYERSKNEIYVDFN